MAKKKGFSGDSIGAQAGPARSKTKKKPKPVAGLEARFFGIGCRLFTLTDGPWTTPDPEILFPARQGVPTFLTDVVSSVNRTLAILDGVKPPWMLRFGVLVHQYAHMAQLCAELLCQREPAVFWSPLLSTDPKHILTYIRDTLTFNMERNESLCFGDSRMKQHADVIATLTEALMIAESRVREAASGIAHLSPHERYSNDRCGNPPSADGKRRKSGPSQSSTAPLVASSDDAKRMGGCNECEQYAQLHSRESIHAPDWSWVHYNGALFQLPKEVQRLIVKDLAACPRGATEPEIRKRLRARGLRPKNAFRRHRESLGEHALVLWRELDGRSVLVLSPFARE
ncbi:MAG: hypothetical protein IPN34_16595 [Planctomycetes bacterium]|nr:hypothetical protein [Planctomycetota bacterium]